MRRNKGIVFRFGPSKYQVPFSILSCFLSALQNDALFVVIFKLSLYLSPHKHISFLRLRIVLFRCCSNSHHRLVRFCLAVYTWLEMSTNSLSCVVPCRRSQLVGRIQPYDPGSGCPPDDELVKILGRGSSQSTSISANYSYSLTIILINEPILTVMTTSHADVFLWNAHLLFIFRFNKSIHSNSQKRKMKKILCLRIKNKSMLLNSIYYCSIRATCYFLTTAFEFRENKK